MEFKDFAINFLVIGLFLFAIISFGVGIQTDNNSNQSILENSFINDSYTDIETILSSSDESLNSSLTAIESETPTEGSESLLFKTIPDVLKTIGGTLKGIYNITIGLLVNLLGLPVIVGQVLMSIILVSIALLFWSVIRTGR